MCGKGWSVFAIWYDWCKSKWIPTLSPWHLSTHSRFDSCNWWSLNAIRCYWMETMKLWMGGMSSRTLLYFEDCEMRLLLLVSCSWRSTVFTLNCTLWNTGFNRFSCFCQILFLVIERIFNVLKLHRQTSCLFDAYCKVT